MRTTINYGETDSLNKQEDMCVQTGGGSDVVVKNNPNILTYVWEEKYSSDTLTRRKITV